MKSREIFTQPILEKNFNINIKLKMPNFDELISFLERDINLSKNKISEIETLLINSNNLKKLNKNQKSIKDFFS